MRYQLQTAAAWLSNRIYILILKKNKRAKHLVNRAPREIRWLRGERDLFAKRIIVKCGTLWRWWWSTTGRHSSNDRCHNGASIQYSLSLYVEYRVERALSPGAESGQEVSSTKRRKSKKKISNYIEATVSKEIVKDFFHSTKGQVESIHSLLRAKTTLSFLFLF